jgi:peptide-methionine (R)-S-oxide reductase
MAGTGEYNNFEEDGVYECAACNAPLYKSTTKFKSGCGWPAFFDGKYAFPSLESKALNSMGIAIPGAVGRHEEKKFGMVRTEITCTSCGGHLGHVFKGEGFPTPSECSLS